MVEPISIITVLGFLVKKVFEKGAEETGKAGASALLERFKKKVGHSSASYEGRKIDEALETWRRKPDDSEAPETLKVYLREAIKTDPHLAAQLQHWLTEAQSQGPGGGGGGIHQVANASGGSVVTQVAGSNNSIKVGK